MQENFNSDLLVAVLMDSIDFVEENFRRGRLRSQVNNLKKNNAINLEGRAAIHFADDVKLNLQRYNLDLITQAEFVENLRELVGQLELNITTEPEEVNHHKRQGV